MRFSSLLLCAAVVRGAVAGAQCPTSGTRSPLPLFVNSEAEIYARVRQVAGDAPLYPWTLRDFSWRESCALVTNGADSGWGRAMSGGRRLGLMRVAALPVTLNLVDNTAFPYGVNDGPVWAGRGLTTSISAGVALQAGPLSIVLAPMMFRAENAPFALHDNGATGVAAFGDPWRPNDIDRPQRFGDVAYHRVDPGNSSVRLDLGGVAIGFSTANQHWGPARDNPFLLGNNAAGYPHVFIGTSRPANIFIGRIATRMHWGRLESSHYVAARDSSGFRLAMGLAAVFQPRGLDGLELGFGRYFHLRWADTLFTRRVLTRPLIGLVRSRLASPANPFGEEPDNQLASIFARWVFPKSGIEVYAEMGKDDYNSNSRDLTLEPDHSSAYLLGFQRVGWRDRGGYLVVRGEVMNARVSSLQLSRPEGPLYVHGTVTEGHTNLGEVLGAPAGNGGGAAGLAVDRYSANGRWSIAWMRALRQERFSSTGTPVANGADLQQTLTWSGLRSRGRLAITYEVTGVYEMNRYFERDARNFRFATGLSWGW